MSDKIKKLTRKNKICFLGIMILLLIVGIRSVYAFYNKSLPSFNMFSSLVGDFDLGDGDINIIIYKETEKGSRVFTKTYSVPIFGYEFDRTEKVPECTIPCVEGNTGNCHYTFDEDNKKFSLTSNQKVTCKFFFNKKADSDINVYIMIEDKDGEEVYKFEGKDYKMKMAEQIPAYGYKYVGYKCDVDDPNDSTDVVVAFDPKTRTFKLSSKVKNTCYAYFIDEKNADIVTTDVYVKDAQSGEYVLVNSIPANTLYVNDTSRSKCYYQETKKPSNASIDYVNGYIEINNITSKQNCEIFLDIKK